MRKKLILFAAAAAFGPAEEALAQPRPPSAPPPAQAKSSPPQKPPGGKPADKAVEGVTVTGQGNETRVSPDRRSYSVAGDLQATSGAIGDALRNIPSVDVDVQGNISLRGDPNVTIMIDGKPSAMFQGQSRADALQRIPADQIERVEVMTNPSAAFSAEGTAGIINLVTKKARGVGPSGTVRANLGDRGRYFASGSFGYNSKKLSLAADGGYRHEKNHSHAEDDRSRFDALAGQVFDSEQTSDAYGEGDFWNGSVRADYDVDAKTRISGGLNFFDQDFHNNSYESFATESASGPIAFDRFGVIRSLFNQKAATASWRRKFAGDEHELTADASYERGLFQGRRRFQNTNRQPASPDIFEDIGGSNLTHQLELKVGYKRPMPDSAKLDVGYNLHVDDNDYDNLGARGFAPDALVPDPQLIDRFRFEQQIHSAYATYERPFGDITAKAGVRLEEVQVDLTQRTLLRRDENDYFRAYPSLHLAWKRDEKTQLTLAYSVRIQRPQPQELNPFRFYQDAFNFREGNPQLEPAETRSYEAGYQYRSGPAMYLATLYFRDRSNEATDVVPQLPSGAFLTTRENIGQSRNAGLELVANGRFGSKLSYNVSGNAYWAEIDASELGFNRTREGTSLSGRANLNWQVTQKDFVQFNVFANGKQLIPQGYREGSAMLNLGYRHKFDDKLAFTLTAQDVLDTFRFNLVLDTPTLKDRIERRGSNRGVFMGLSYAFGGPSRRRQPEGFDFGGPSAPQ